jgi:uncharacterized protein with PQ loop repeat
MTSQYQFLKVPTDKKKIVGFLAAALMILSVVIYQCRSFSEDSQQGIEKASQVIAVVSYTLWPLYFYMLTREQPINSVRATLTMKFCATLVVLVSCVMFASDAGSEAGALRLGASMMFVVSSLVTHIDQQFKAYALSGSLLLVASSLVTAFGVRTAPGVAPSTRVATAAAMALLATSVVVLPSSSSNSLMVEL